MATHPVAVAGHLALPVDFTAHVFAALVDLPALDFRSHQVPSEAARTILGMDLARESERAR